MYNFDGQYKRSREQNLAGASKLSAGKDELISRAHKERMKRQVDRKREESAVKIQKVIRGALCRIALRKKLRTEFYNKLYECDTRPISTNDIYYLLSRITYWTYDGITLDDMVSILKKALVVSDEILRLATSNMSWAWKIKVLIKFALRGFDQIQITIPMDVRARLMLDTAFTFTSPNLPAATARKIFYYLLMDRYYLKVLRHFLLRLNSYSTMLFDENAKECAEMERNRAITLITRPFTYIDNSDSLYSDVAINALFDVVSCDCTIPEPIKEWIIPALQNNGNFPFGRVIMIFSVIKRPIFLSSTLYFFLLMDKDQTAVPSDMQSRYFSFLVPLTRFLTRLPELPEKEVEEDNNAVHDELHKDMLVECVKLLNTPTRSQIWINCLNEAIRRNDVRTVKRICSCVVHLQLSDPVSSFKYRIINDLWLAEGWMRGLWVIIESQKRTYPEQVPLTKILGRGMILEPQESSLILPLLSVFCSCLFAALSFISDDDLLKRDIITTKGVKPFTKNELVYIAIALKDVAIGMIVLGFPDSHAPAESMAHFKGPSDNRVYNSVIWQHTLIESIKFVTEVYYRNERLKLNPLTEWHSDLIPIPEHLFQNVDLTNTNVPQPTMFATQMVRTDPRERMGASYDRASKLLCTIPFLIPCARRFRMLWSEINRLINEYQNPRVHFSHNVHLCITIRRDYLYEDSFEKLSFDNAPDLNIAVRVRFTNSLNMDEAGIDGGGIFREFISELLKTAFDPNRGFFILTKDNKLYPNPNVSTVYPNFTTHYFFIGRMLAKAIYERVIVDIPLAEFFLAKIIDTTSLYPSLLYSLDNDLFKNISYLRTYNGDYSTLGLDFSTTNNSFGSNEVIQLKPNGSDIPVTGENVLEYLHLIAKQKLHIDISKQTRAFAKGLGNIVRLSMIQMFTPKEIQLIISGNISTIELADLQQYCTYSGGYNADHANIKLFWKVMADFTDEQKCQLLKFVTSCSRPPLSGFRELNPPFCIHLVDENDAPLPTASTCMNILKLPLYKDEDTMREKLLYAIQSGAGFELS